MYKFRIDYFLEFDNDGEKIPFYDVVFASSPAAAVDRLINRYADPDVEFELVSVFEC